MTWQDGIALLAILTGSLFFLGGTIGLLRFPDVYARLHALTKADNTGLSLIILGLSLRRIRLGRRQVVAHLGPRDAGQHHKLSPGGEYRVAFRNRE